MRAIIIDDKDAKSLLEKLELTKFREQRTNSLELQKILEEYKVPKSSIDIAISEIHRQFHYTVCKWLQEQGASTI